MFSKRKYSVITIFFCFFALIVNMIAQFCQARGENDLLPLEVLSNNNVEKSIAIDETLSWITVDYSDSGSFLLWEMNFKDKTLVSRKIPFPVTQVTVSSVVALCPHNTQYLYVAAYCELGRDPESIIFYGIDENYYMHLLGTVDFEDLDVWGWPMISDLFVSQEAVYFRDCFGNNSKWNINDRSLLQLDYWIEDENEQGDYLFFITGEDIDVMKWWRHSIQDLLLHHQITGREIDIYHNSHIDSASRIWYHWQGQMDFIVISEGAVLGRPSINKYHISNEADNIIICTNSSSIYVDASQDLGNSLVFTDTGDYIAFFTTEAGDDSIGLIVVQSVIDGKSCIVFREAQGGILVSQCLIWRHNL